MVGTNLELRAKAYLDAFESRDLAACMSFFSEGATLTFYTSHYSGHADIEEWHQDRFKADLRLIQLEQISVDEDTVTIQAVGASKRLKRLHIQTISGSVVMRFQGDLIQELSFSPRLGSW